MVNDDLHETFHEWQKLEIYKILNLQTWIEATVGRHKTDLRQ